jgi:hypothetical protein
MISYESQKKKYLNNCRGKQKKNELIKKSTMIFNKSLEGMEKLFNFTRA